MKKIKLFIASMLGAIALVFACVLGTRVNAYTEDIEIQYTALTAWAPSTPKIYSDDVNGITITSGKRLQSKSTGDVQDSEGNNYSNAGQLDNGNTLTITTSSKSNIKVYSYCKSTSSTITVGDSVYNSKGGFIDEFLFTNEVKITTSGSNGAGIYKIVIKNGVKPLQQEAVVGESTFIRFIFIISGNSQLSSSNFSNKLTLILDDGKNTKQTVTRSPKAYNKLLLGGDTYVDTVDEASYTFDNAFNSTDIYVVYVVEFTTATYSGHSVKASLNVGGTEYKTSGYDFA